jgi:hypothetical protein
MQECEGDICHELHSCGGQQVVSRLKAPGWIEPFSMKAQHRCPTQLFNSREDLMWVVFEDRLHPLEGSVFAEYSATL